MTRSVLASALALTVLCTGARAAELPTLLAGKQLQPGWPDHVKLVDDSAARGGKALLLKLTPELGKETGVAYWGWREAGQITGGPKVALQPHRRYRALVRLKGTPNLGSGSAITLSMSTDGTNYNPQITWRNVRRYFGFQLAQAGEYQELPVEFTTGDTGEVVPEVRVVNIGPLADGRSTGGGDLEEIALDLIRFEDITPPLAVSQVRTDRGCYRRADAKNVSVTVRNFTAKPQKAELRVTLHSDLDTAAPVASPKLSLQPGEQKEMSFPLQTEAEFGYEVRAELLRGGKTIDAGRDVFTVADNVYKIQMWTSAGPTNPQAFCRTGEVDMRTVPELVAAMREDCCNFYEFFAWPPDDGLDFVPEGERWWAGQNGYPESRSNLQGIIRELHKQGIRAFMYAAWWSNGTGLETFRKHPDWFLYDAVTGQGGGCDIAGYKKAKQLRAEGKEGLELLTGGGGGGAAPNWTDPRVVDAGLDSMRESIRMFGWDGVRWDGEYQMTYYLDKMDFQGRKMSDLCKDPDEANTRILQQIIERFRREEPQFAWGYNNEMNPKLWGDNPPKAVRYKLEQGGSLMWESPREAPMPTNPSHAFAEYSRNTCEMADYCRERGGYFMQFPAGHQWVGTAHDRIYKTVLPVVGGSTVYGNTAFVANTIGQYNRFIARYCSLWWGDEVRSVREPARFLAVEGSGPIWWKDYVDSRPAGPNARDLIIHLVNEPVVKEIGPDAVGRMPAAQQEIRVRLRADSQGRAAKAWFLTAEPEIQCRELEVNRTGEGDEVLVPALRCWSVVVLRVEGGKW